MAIGKKTPTMDYRPEVDGLRAVAVLPVILFHAGIGGFDDKVIYSSAIENLRPLNINFELANLDVQSATAVDSFLTECGYIVSPHGTGGLAIRTISP
jgi:peptidoglycan/LPS O-acetylase OafA/YrhL